MNRIDNSSPVTVLITGASGGIGQALALHYAAPGRTLALQGRDAGRVNRITSQCEAKGAKVIAGLFDVRETEQLRAWIRDVDQQAAIDLAIINAGITSNMTETPQGESWARMEQVIDINLKAALATCDAVLQPMLQRAQGQIALISSLSAYYGLPVTPAYCASKAGLKAYGEAMRGWLRSRGVQMSVVLPGFVKTDMSDTFPAAKPLMLTPQRAAQIIAKGLANNRARISFPFPLNFGMWGLAVLPPSWSGFILRLLRYNG